MVARNRGRYLAPIALIATIAATVTIVRAGLGTRHPSAPVQRVDGGSTSQQPPARTHTNARTFYVIKAGDNLSSIAAKTGVSVATLEALNPSVDPYALQTGQRLRLRR